jgi:hypothetical protein
VKSARGGDNPQFPIHPNQVFRNANAPYLANLEEEIFALSRKLSNLWTERGANFVYLGNFLEWTIFLPTLLRMYGFQLKRLRALLNSRRPLMLDYLKCTLVKYVRDATGRRGWYDAQLALLCHEERRAWTKWRNTHYQPPPPPTTDRSDF